MAILQGIVQTFRVCILTGWFYRQLPMPTQLRFLLWLPVVWGSAVLGTAHAAPTWLTIIGDPTRPTVDTVEVDASSAVTFGKARLVGIRVNRAKDRMALDKQSFRSYESLVVIDCEKHTARHNSQTLFPEPLWKGVPRAHTYDEKDIRDMAFNGVEPNPKERIIKAACSIELVQSK